MVVCGFGHDGILLSSSCLKEGCGFWAGLLCVQVELGAGRFPEFVDESLELRSVIDVVPDAGDDFQPVFYFDLGVFQCR